MSKVNLQTNRNKFAQKKHKEKHHIKLLGLLEKKYSIENNWVFTGTFDNFENLQMLHTLLKWILLVMSNHVENMKHVEKVLNVQYQLLITSLLIQ